MAAVDPGECQVLADLARLSLSEDEARAFAGQLGKILGHIEQLSQVDVTDVPEYLSAEVAHSALRADEAGPTLDVEAALAGTPAHDGNLVQVPKFKED